MSRSYSDLPENGQEDFEMRNLLLAISSVIWASLGGAVRPLAVVQSVIKPGQLGRGVARGYRDRSGVSSQLAEWPLASGSSPWNSVSPS